MKTKLLSGLWLITLVGWVSVVWVTSLQADSAAQVISVGSAVKVTADDGASSDQFGDAIAVDAGLGAIGAAGHDADGDGTREGATYIAWFNSSPRVTDKLIAADGEALDGFGHAVGVDYYSYYYSVIVGAPMDDDPVAGEDAGSAYVFYREGSGWNQQAKLLADDAAGGD